MCMETPLMHRICNLIHILISGLILQMHFDMKTTAV